MADDSTITLVDSPSLAPQPLANKDGIPDLILNQSEVVTKTVVTAVRNSPAFGYSAFTESAANNDSRSEHLAAELKDFKFSCPAETPPARKLTIEESFNKQISGMRVQSSVSYHAVSKDVVNAVCERLALGPEKAATLTEDSKTTDQISKIIQAFVLNNFKVQMTYQQKFEFISNQPRCGVTSVSSDKTMLDFYNSILPIGRIESTKAASCRQPARCVAKTKSGKKDQCKKRSHLDTDNLDVLVQELLSLPIPCEFSKIIKILVSIADMVFCKAWHLDDARLALYHLREHFYTAASPPRESELECLRQWLRDLIRIGGLNKEVIKAECEDERLKQQNTLSALLLTLPAGGTEFSSPLRTACEEGGVKDAKGASELFLFTDKSGFENSGFKDGEFDFMPSLTQKFQPFKVPKTQRNLTAQQLVNYWLQKPLTDLDRKGKGSMYVYGHRGSFGYVKIGRSCNTEGRYASWEKKCTYLIDACEDLLQGIDREAPHPKRLEQLIHAELKVKRCQIRKCERCSGMHTEWFYVRSDEAQRVVSKWTKWMQKEPYDEGGELIPGRREQITVGDCESVPEPVGPKKGSDQNKTSRRGSTPRRSRVTPSERSYPQSTHHMETRSKGESS